MPLCAVSSQISFCVPFMRAPATSTNPKFPFSTRSTATSAGAPTDRFPRSSRLISRAGCHVERHPHIKELRHHVQHVLHARVHAADVQVGRDRIGYEALLDGGRGLPEKKAAADRKSTR